VCKTYHFEGDQLASAKARINGGMHLHGNVVPAGVYIARVCSTIPNGVPNINQRIITMTK
jgi:hypothetical protein